MQRCAQGCGVDVPDVLLFTDGHGRSRSGRLAGAHAGSHDPDGAERFVRGADAASGHKQAVRLRRDKAAVGNVVALFRACDLPGIPALSLGVMDIDAVAVVRDGVRELPSRTSSPVSVYSPTIRRDSRMPMPFWTEAA